MKQQEGPWSKTKLITITESKYTDANTLIQTHTCAYAYACPNHWQTRKKISWVNGKGADCPNQQKTWPSNPTRAIGKQNMRKCSLPGWRVCTELHWLSALTEPWPLWKKKLQWVVLKSQQFAIARKTTSATWTASGKRRWGCSLWWQWTTALQKRHQRPQTLMPRHTEDNRWIDFE